MKRLLGMAALAGAGVLAYRAMKNRKNRHELRAQTPTPPVRDAGPEAMRDQPGRWGRTDQRSDESFPASDPPSTY